MIVLNYLLTISTIFIAVSATPALKSLEDLNDMKNDTILYLVESDSTESLESAEPIDTANSELLPVEANVPAVNTDIIGIVSDKPIIGEEVAEGEEEEEEDQSSLVLPTQQINPDNLITLKENQEPEIVKDVPEKESEGTIVAVRPTEQPNVVEVLVAVPDDHQDVPTSISTKPELKLIDSPEYKYKIIEE